jgi:hypothetical protein
VADLLCVESGRHRADLNGAASQLEQFAKNNPHLFPEIKDALLKTAKQWRNQAEPGISPETDQNVLVADDELGPMPAIFRELGSLADVVGDGHLPEEPRPSRSTTPRTRTS